MPSDKPRITLRIEPKEMEHLEHWAKEEFLTVPQLARVIMRRAIAVRYAQDFPEPHPTDSEAHYRETKDKAPQTFTELVRINYFALMNTGKINHSRLKELAFSQKPSVTELTIIAKVLNIPEEVVTDLRDRTFKKEVS